MDETAKSAFAAVRDIMTRDVITVEPESTLREVVEVLTAHRISGVPVVSGHRLVGVISMSDLIDFIATTPPVPAARTDQSDWDELGLGLPDEESQSDEQSVEFYTDLWPDAGADVVERFAESEQPEWDLLAEQTVSSLHDPQADHARA